MKKLLFISVLPALFALAGCDKPEPSTTASTTETAEPAKGEASEKAEGSEGVDNCGQAYEDLVALVAGLEEQLGSSDSEMPKRDAFLASCRSLPTEVQQCMVFEYGMANQDECQKRIDGLDAEQKKKAEELMGK